MSDPAVPVAFSQLTSRLTVLLAAIAVVLPFDVAGAQTSSNSTTLTVGRTAEAIDALVSRYGYVITFEEPGYSYADDFEDMPAQYRRDLDRYPKGAAAPKVLVPRGNPLTLTVPVSSVVSTQDIAAVLRQLVQLQSASDHGAHFRVEQVGDAFNVIPTETRDRNGNWSAQKSIFDAAITIPKQERSAMGTVNAVCAAVGAASHVSVNLLTGPMTMLLYTRSVIGASDEPARSVMTRALSGLNRKLSWRVGYFAQLHSYLLVITVVPEKSPPAVTKAAAPSTSAAPVTPPSGSPTPLVSPMGGTAPK